MTMTHNWNPYVPQALALHSPLYAQIAQDMRTDPEILALANLAQPDQPQPVFFLSVVSFLVLQTRDHPLAAFYPVLTDYPRPPVEVYPVFRDFCLQHKAELGHLLATKRLQTNEVARCSHLLPAFEVVFQRSGRKPLFLVEIGASAGLNLLWDKYVYQYKLPGGNEVTVGEADDPVTLCCTLKGERVPPLPEHLTAMVGRRIGIDLAPLDVTDGHDVNWLRACIWPEEQRRYETLTAACAVFQDYFPVVLPGDACELLPSLLGSVPKGVTICVYHSYALFQGPSEVRTAIFDFLERFSAWQNIYRVSLEINQEEQWAAPRLELFTYQQGALTQQEWLATCDVHGTFLEWVYTQ